MNKTAKTLERIFLIFILGSVLGYIYETILVFFQTGHYESRQGLIYGPFIPVYGIGAVMYYFVVTKVKHPVNIFLCSMVLGGVAEYICSYAQEIFFGTISWDYSNLVFNLNGRTSLIHCILWGLAGIFYRIIAYPFIKKWVNNYKKAEFKVFTFIVVLFMTANIIISCAAGSRQNERVKQIPATSELDKLLDRYYPDSVMDKIYANKIVTVKRKEPILKLNIER